MSQFGIGAPLFDGKDIVDLSTGLNVDREFLGLLALSRLINAVHEARDVDITATLEGVRTLINRLIEVETQRAKATPKPPDATPLTTMTEAVEAIRGGAQATPAV